MLVETTNMINNFLFQMYPHQMLYLQIAIFLKLLFL